MRFERLNVEKFVLEIKSREANSGYDAERQDIRNSDRARTSSGCVESRGWRRGMILANNVSCPFSNAYNYGTKGYHERGGRPPC